MEYPTSVIMAGLRHCAKIGSRCPHCPVYEKCLNNQGGFIAKMALEMIEQLQGWILPSEQLPPENEVVDATVLTKTGERYMCNVWRCKEEWWGHPYDSKVIAWTPIKTLYEGDI